MAGRTFNGALAGWKRTESANGIVLTLQVAESNEAYQDRSFHRLNVALNKRQLRSLARDLGRAAEDQGLQLYAKRRWWQFWG